MTLTVPRSKPALASGPPALVSGAPVAHPGVQQYALEDMVGGWFVGSFTPTALSAANAEVAFKRIAAGTVEASHEHRIGSEVTLVVSGSVRLCGRVLRAGDILTIPPRTATGFEALEDSSLIVIKTPSIPGDKYLVPEDPRTWV